MERPSVEEIRKFLRENYGPEWEDRIELGYKLWEKRYGKRNYSGSINTNARYTPIHVSELRDRILAEIEGIVIEKDEFSYWGCPVCFRSANKGCQHLDNGEVEPVVLTVEKMVVNDGTGDLTVSKIFKPDEPNIVENISIGDLIKVRGYVRINGDEKRLYLNEVEIVKAVPRDEEDVDVQVRGNLTKQDDVSSGETQQSNNQSTVIRIDDLAEPLKGFLRYLSNTGGMKKSVAEAVMDRKGLTWDDVKDYVEIKDDTVVLKEGII